MRIEDQVRADYFEWLYDIVRGDRFAKMVSFRKLLTFLHAAEFTYTIPHDKNRAGKGINLRYRYCLNHDCEHLEHYLSGPCSVFEMMVALAIDCEDIVADEQYRGDRTAQWFWEMIKSLGLGGMHDSNFNEWLVSDVIGRFLDRDYEPDGRGGLFTVRGWDRDMRTAEIWHQLMAYINNIV